MWKETFGWLGRHLATMIIIFGILGAVARPWAEDFITDTVSKEKFVTQQQLEKIDTKTIELDRAIQILTNELRGLSNNQAKTERDLEFLKDLQREQRQDTKRIMERLGVPR